MEDVYDATLVCNKCNVETTKSYVIKDGFKIRIWACPRCKKKWYHPKDMEDYNEFRKLKKRDFEVKLRPVGNSWAISIPKEIIQFENVHETKVIRMCMDEPGKLNIYFRKIRKVY
ncbi:hypothetical protein D6777_03355 [Candidatus Woesearchaeota archaeon]|nr:MAG: hypothetical protein D6777_03355 [Candidatus Woesearchaeota archaeon]